MLDANLQSQLKTYLERVTRPIQITAHADDGAKSQEMLELLQTLESLSDKISLQVLRDGQGRVPSFDLGTPDGLLCMEILQTSGRLPSWGYT